jgi:hypothetical protein
MQLVTSVNLPGWETFRPEEVDQQLAITGFTVSDSTNPWAPAGPRYMATVHATGEQPS